MFTILRRYAEHMLQSSWFKVTPRGQISHDCNGGAVGFILPKKPSLKIFKLIIWEGGLPKEPSLKIFKLVT